MKFGCFGEGVGGWVMKSFICLRFWKRKTEIYWFFAAGGRFLKRQRENYHFLASVLLASKNPFFVAPNDVFLRFLMKISQNQKIIQSQLSNLSNFIEIPGSLVSLWSAIFLFLCPKWRFFSVFNENQSKWCNKSSQIRPKWQNCI